MIVIDFAAEPGMNRRTLFTTPALAVLLIAHASAETVFQCRGADGAPVFSDLPCTRELPADATRLGIRLHNFIEGMALGEADRRQLEEIDARPRGRAFVGGLPDPERDARCTASREAYEQLRRQARKGHDGSLRAERRRLRSELREHCH